MPIFRAEKNRYCEKNHYIWRHFLWQRYRHIWDRDSICCILCQPHLFYWRNSHSLGRKLQAVIRLNVIVVEELRFMYARLSCMWVTWYPMVLDLFFNFIRIGLVSSAIPHSTHTIRAMYVRLLFEFYLFTCDEEVIWKRNNHSVNVKGANTPK